MSKDGITGLDHKIKKHLREGEGSHPDWQSAMESVGVPAQDNMFF